MDEFENTSGRPPFPSDDNGSNESAAPVNGASGNSAYNYGDDLWHVPQDAEPQTQSWGSHEDPTPTQVQPQALDPYQGQDSYQAAAQPQDAFAQQDPYQAQPQDAYQTQQQTRRGPAEPSYASYDAPSAVPAVPTTVAESKATKGASGVKTVLMGLLGGAIGAVAVSLVMNAVGLAGTGGTTRSVPTAESAAGQTIDITATSEDITIAKAVAAKALPSVVSVYVSSSMGEGLGSGVVLDTDGNIITNYHVVEGAESITVTIGGKSYDATLVGTDASSDLAVVHAELNGDAVTPIEVGDSDALVVGDWVMTIGSPFGLDQSVSAGIVSSLSRNQLMASTSGNTLYTNLIQTDAAINPGNSGGALVNSEGKLVGIDTLFSSDTESFAGIGFAIPGNYAVEVANKIIAGEQVTHAYIGLSMQTVNAQSAQMNHLSVNQGAYVAEVSEGGPAEEAGIQEGDIIISLDGEDITSADGMILAVRSHKIGETVEIGFMRGNEEMTAQVTFADDAELQKLQQQQLEEQQKQEEEMYGLDGNGYGIRDDRGDEYGYTYEDIFDYLFNNRNEGMGNQ